MNNEATEIAAPTKRRRLHWTTWLLGTCVLFVCVLMNVGWNWTYDEAGEWVIAYGWPWNYAVYSNWPLDIDEYVKADWLYLYRIQNAETFHVGLLLADMTFVAVIVNVVVFSWEQRLHYRKRWYRFTILEWFACCALFAGGYGVLEWLYRDNYTDQRLKRILNKCDVELAESEYCPTWEHENDYPCDWLLELLNVPENWKPYRKVGGELVFKPLEIADEDTSAITTVTIPVEAFKELNKFRYLKKLRLQLSNMPAKRKIELPVDALSPMQENSTLERLHIRVVGKVLHEEHFPVLAQLSALEDIEINDAPTFRGHNLAMLKQIKDLSLISTGIDDAGMEQISQLRQLERLSLYENPNISATACKRFLPAMNQLNSLRIKVDWKNEVDAWRFLGAFHELQSLEIECPSFSNEDLQHLRHATKLDRLSLQNSLITFKSLETIKNLPALSWLSIDNIRPGSQPQPPSHINIDPKLGFTPANEQQFLKLIGSSPAADNDVKANSSQGKEGP